VLPVSQSRMPGEKRLGLVLEHQGDDGKGDNPQGRHAEDRLDERRTPAPMWALKLS
jgi:hypothetical protein